MSKDAPVTQREFLLAMVGVWIFIGVALGPVAKTQGGWQGASLHSSALGILLIYFVRLAMSVRSTKL